MEAAAERALLNANLRIRLIGPPLLLLPDGTAHALERKNAALLALLALEGSAQPSHVAALLWPDTSDAQARANLRQRLFRLRGLTQREMVLSGALLRLADDVSVDLNEAGELLRSDPLAGSGELLGHHDYADLEALDAWAARAREGWRCMRLQQLARLADEMQAQQSFDAALRYAERIVAEDPLAEHGYQRLMRLHHLRGDRGAALAAFDRCKAVLHRELGEMPGNETCELALTLSQGAAAAPLRMCVPEVLRRPPALIARGDALQAILHAWDAGSPALVIAPPGFGKTRLLEELVAQHAQLCLLGCRPGDDNAPYASLARLLRELRTRLGTPDVEPHQLAPLARLVPEFGACNGAAPLEPAALRSALEQALRAWQQRGLAGVLVDDLQFADPASIELLLPLTAAPAGVHWLFAVRAQEMPEALTRWVGDVRGTPPITVTLPPLDAAGMLALVASLRLPGLEPAQWAPRLLEHTGGTPSMLLATLTELHTHQAGPFGLPPATLPLPKSIGAALQGRLRRLTPQALQVAYVAAAAQLDLAPEMCADILDRSVPTLVAPWRELEDAHVLSGTRFSHDLMREAVLADLPQAIAHALHRRIADWLAQHGAPAARVAVHWWCCEAWAQSADAYERAAADASRLTRAPEQRAFLQRAAEAHACAGAAAAAFHCRWQAVHAMLFTETVQQALEAADALVADAQGAAQLQYALEARAAVYIDLHDPRRALSDIAAARAGGAAPACPKLRVRLARREGVASTSLNLQTQALQALGDVQQVALALDDIDERLGWRNDMALALDYADRLEEALAALLAIAADAETAGRWKPVSEALSSAAITLIYLGRLRESCTLSERSIALSYRHGGPGGNVSIDEMTHACTLRDLGRFDQALELGTRAADALRQAGHAAWAANAENDLAGAYHWLGRDDLAFKCMRPIPDHAPDWCRGARLLVEAAIDRRRGIPAGDRIARAAQCLSDVGRSYVRLKVALELARHASPADGASLAAGVVERALQCQQHACAGQAMTLQVEALLLSGQVEAAGTAAARLIAHLQQHDVVAMYAAEPWWVACQALQARGDTAAARAALERALQWVHTQALPHVPALYRSSFLQRNPVNAALLRAAASNTPG